MLENATQDTETLIKIVPDFQVGNVNNSYDPAITDLANGEFLVTWTAYNQDPNNSEIYGLRYNENGTPVGQVFRVNTSTRNQENSSSATTLSNGSFVVTWTSNTLDGYQSEIYGQRFNASGTKIGREFRVNTQTEGQQLGASVEALTNGGFVVIWNSSDTDGSQENVYGQRYSANGNKVGQEFRVHEYTNNAQYLNSVAALADGGFIVSWSSYNQDSFGRYNTYVQRFSASGAKVGQEFLIDPDFRALNTTVTSLADGRYIIAWSSYTDNNILQGHYGQLYNLDGSKIGVPFQLDLGTAITALTSGGFVVTGEVYPSFVILGKPLLLINPETVV